MHNALPEYAKQRPASTTEKVGTARLAGISDTCSPVRACRNDLGPSHRQLPTLTTGRGDVRLTTLSVQLFSTLTFPSCAHEWIGVEGGD